MVKQIKVVIKNSEVNCCGVYSIENNTLTVKKGSVIRSQCSPSFKYQEKRVKQIEKCCTIENGITVVTKDTCPFFRKYRLKNSGPKALPLCK